MIYDCIVVGKGLIGAAAARYLCQYQKVVAAIGPDEPKDLDSGIVFSSHYDQGRIQRIIGTDAVWTLLNLQSAGQYAYLQKESGIMFYTGAGCLYVNPTGTDAYLEQAQTQGRQFNVEYQEFKDGSSITKSFPDFNFPVSSRALFEKAPAGFINPRLLIEAQLYISKKNGGTVINDIVNGLSSEKDHIQIATLSGNIYKAKKVLLCPGAFTNFFPLAGNKLSFTLKSETTIQAKVSEKDAKQLSHLPSLLYEIDIPEYSNIYLIQPILYPDGNYYLKMGCNLPADIYFDNLGDVQNWFKNGDSDANLEVLRDSLMMIMKTLKIESIATRRCIISFTKHRKPYIGALDNKGLFVATGGNGYSAMCSDALGRIVAHLVTEGAFPKEYSPESFLPVFESK